MQLVSLFSISDSLVKTYPETLTNTVQNPPTLPTVILSELASSSLSGVLPDS